MDRPSASGERPENNPRHRAGAGQVDRGGAAAPRRWISWRSVLLGTLAVTLVCGLTPYNDYVVANTFMVGGYLPPIMVVWFFLVIVLINGPLHRWAPRYALGSGELAVIMAMMLVGCSLPSQGLMRAFLPMLVFPFERGGVDPRFWDLFLALDLPDWLFPVERIEQGRRSLVVTGFYHRLEEGAAMPLTAWIAPLAAWGVFLFALFGALLSLALLLRGQWAENERLPFPIVQLQVALIESPRPGRMLNEMLGSRAFWIALGAVAFAHSTVALHAYWPQYVPEIPLGYDLSGIFANEPWVHFHYHVKAATIFFTFVGIAYFIQARIAFSLWGIYLVVRVIEVYHRSMQSEIPGAAWMDQYLGSAVAFVAGFLWIGRRHWWLAIQQAVRGERPGEPRGRFLSHRAAILVLAGSLAVMFAWLLFMGVQPWVAVMILTFLMMSHLVVARIVAETGLPFIRAYTTFPQLYTNLSPDLMSGRDVFFSGAFTMNGAFATRESLLPFTLHGVQTFETTEPSPRQRLELVGLIVWALALGFVIAAASSLYCYYNYYTPITDRVQSVLNPHALEVLPVNDLARPLVQHGEGHFPEKRHDPWLHMGIGAGVTGFLQFAALRWTGWPFMPVGYLISNLWYAHVAWFSLFLGWLAKVVIVRYGGARLFQQARPVFVGMIFGEALAAGLWLAINISLAWMGYEYQRILFLPD